MADKAYITPKVLKWARESAKMSEEIAALKVAVPADKLKAWEKGESYPTIRQARNLAKAYRRPFAVFFLPDIPNDFQPLQDFRKKGSKELSTPSVFIIREVQLKQSWMREMNEENKEGSIVSFVGKYTLQDNPADVANDILNTLNIDPLSYKKSNPILEWVNKAESNGIYISRTSFIHSRLKLDLNEIQGFAIADKYAPFVFVNSDDWDAPQLFTLVHELAHIWIAATGISNEIEPVIKNNHGLNPIERFCNEVAGNALMPYEFMSKLDNKTFVNAKEVFKSAKLLGVSSFALLVRAFNLNMITWEDYRKLRTEAEHEFQAFLRNEEKKKARQEEKEKDSPIYYPLTINKNGRLFTQSVLDAFHGGIIEPTEASNLLNVKVNKFPKLEEQMYRWR